jgi:hypothetical protein
MTRPLSPAAREALDWLVVHLCESKLPRHADLGAFLSFRLHEPVAEPVREWGVRHSTDLVSQFDDQQAARISIALCPPGCDLVSRLPGGEWETVAREPVVPAEPVSVLPEGDGTGEGLREALRAEIEMLKIRADLRRQQRDEARAERDRLREEVTQLRAENDRVAVAIQRVCYEASGRVVSVSRVLRALDSDVSKP